MLCAAISLYIWLESSVPLPAVGPDGDPDPGPIPEPAPALERMGTEEEEEEEEEEGEEEEGGDEEEEAPAARSTSSSRAGRNPPAGYSQRTSKSSQEQEIHDTSDEAQDDESIDRSASPLPLVVRQAPRASSSASAATYGGTSNARRSVEATAKEKQKENEKEREKEKEKEKQREREKQIEKEKQEIEKQRQREKQREKEIKKPSKPSNSTSTSTSTSGSVALSRADTVHLGLELEESLDWPGSQDEGESERGSAQDEDDFYKDTNYTRKRTLGPSSDTRTGEKKARVEKVTSRARGAAASLSEPKSDTSEESMPAPRRASSRGKQIPESVQDPPEEEPDLFAGLAMPSRKRYR